MRLEANWLDTELSVCYLYTPDHNDQQVWFVYCVSKLSPTYLGAHGKSRHSLQLAIDDAATQLRDMLAKRNSASYTQLPDVEIDLGDLLDF